MSTPQFIVYVTNWPIIWEDLSCSEWIARLIDMETKYFQKYLEGIRSVPWWTCHSLSYKIRQLVWCFKIYWRYSMATGGWIFQTGDFTAVGISSRLWFSNFLPTDIFRLQTKFASHHDDDDYVAIETKASQQVWWSGVSSLVRKFAFVALIKGLNSNPPSWQYLCC